MILLDDLDLFYVFYVFYVFYLFHFIPFHSFNDLGHDILPMNHSFVTILAKNRSGCFDCAGEDRVVGRVCIDESTPLAMWRIQCPTSHTHMIFMEVVLRVCAAVLVILLDCVTHLVKTK